MQFNEVKQVCLHFKGNIPCKPNKEHDYTCTNCPVYAPISKRIAIIKLGALGDVIRTTPLVVKFNELYPNCHITWLTQSPDVLPTKQIQTILKPDAFALHLLTNKQFDIAINLDKEEEACLLLQQITANEKYGYIYRDGRIQPATPAAEHKLMTGYFDALSKINTKSYLKEIFEICHFEFQGEPYLINKNELLANDWKQQLQDLAKGKMIVGLNTGCGPRWNTRLWSNEAWIELAEQLKKAGLFPVFLGGELEHEKNTLLASATGAFYPGHFPLESFVALTDACDVIVTQVTMMMHIATALQKKMILMNTIFNAHEFELYGRGEIVQPPNGCVCFYGNTCSKGKACMHEITPDMIHAAVLRTID